MIKERIRKRRKERKKSWKKCEQVRGDKKEIGKKGEGSENENGKNHQN